MNVKRKATMMIGTLVGASILLLAGCGGGGSSSSGDDNTESSAASRGVITGFGSVYVNGVRYLTDDARFHIDDDDGDESDLEIGMIVTVFGSSVANGEAHAHRIIYDNELKGPVTAIVVDPMNSSRKTLTILGQSVLLNADTKIDDDGGLTFASIAIGDVLEVSGYLTDTGITATHVELQDNDLEIEIKGYIENLTANSFTIRGFAVSYDGSTELDDIRVLAEGIFVEVEGRLDGLGTTLIASEIEREDEGLDDDFDEVEIKGVISAYNAGDKRFMLQGQQIDASRAELFPASLQLADGLTVEVEGYIEGGVLFADKVKLKGSKVKIQAELSAVDVGAATVSFNFNATNITVRVNSGTEIEDDISDNDITLADLSAGNFVELEAFAEGGGVLNAVEIERTDPDDVRINAPVESFDAVNRLVTLLGVEFDLSAASFENANDDDVTAAEFFAALVVGEFIKIKDDDGNAVFDEAELDDD